jgi:nucleotide-binding universal stress UspA family protein
MFKKILVPTDFSAASQKVVECLPGLKSVGVQEVVIAHVVDIRLAGGLAVSLQKSDEEILEQNKAELEQVGLKVKTEVLVGIPFVEIVRLANRESASMIMMAEKGTTFAEEVLLGSVTESVIRHAKRPVLIQKFAPLEGKPKEECALVCENIFRRVLYATDFSDSAEKVIDYIKEMKDAGCDEIIVFHVQDTRILSHHPESRIEEFNQIDSERLARIKNELEQSGFKKVTTRLDTGVSISRILEVADELDVSLIAMGAYGKSKVAEMLLGSVSENVARSSTKPVLLVHAI